MGHAPEAVRPLLLQVKEYEHLTVQGAVEHSHEAAREAWRKSVCMTGRDRGVSVVGLHPGVQSRDEAASHLGSAHQCVDIYT